MLKINKNCFVLIFDKISSRWDSETKPAAVLDIFVTFVYRLRYIFIRVLLKELQFNIIYVYVSVISRNRWINKTKTCFLVLLEQFGSNWVVCVLLLPSLTNKHIISCITETKYLVENVMLGVLTSLYLYKLLRDVHL